MIKMTIEVTPEIAVKVAEILRGNESAPQNVTAASIPLTPPIQTAPVQQPIQPPAFDNAVPTQPPIPQTPVQVMPSALSVLPTAPPPEYALPQLQQACAPLMDQGRQQELVGLINSFGVPSLTQLPKERFGEFATALRGLGAQI